MNKTLMIKRFAKNLEHYNDNAKIQKQMAEKLLSFINKCKFDSVLEIGCGTGLMTSLAVNKISYKKYIANDIVPDCEKFIKNIDSNIEVRIGDVETIIKNSCEKYDLIISNASFQWIEDLESFIETLINRLKPNGILLFSTFGMENLREIRYITGKGLNYYSYSELCNLLKNSKYRAEEEIRVINFKTPSDVLKHLKYTGVNSISSEQWTKKDLKSFENEYNNFCSNRPSLTYHPIYVMIEKN